MVSKGVKILPFWMSAGVIHVAGAVLASVVSLLCIWLVNSLTVIALSPAYLPLTPIETNCGRPNAPGNRMSCYTGSKNLTKTCARRRYYATLKEMLQKRVWALTFFCYVGDHPNFQEIKTIVRKAWFVTSSFTIRIHSLLHVMWKSSTPSQKNPKQ